MTPTLTELLAGMRTVIDRATLGPWLVVGGDDEYCSGISGVISQAEYERIKLKAAEHRGDFPVDTQWIAVSPGCAPVNVGSNDGDYEFIVAAHTQWPATVDALQAAVDRLTHHAARSDKAVLAQIEGILRAAK